MRLASLLTEGARSVVGAPVSTAEVPTSAHPTYAPLYGQAFLRSPAGAQLLWELYLNVPVLRRAVSIYAALVGCPELAADTDPATTDLREWASTVEHGHIGTGLSSWVQDCVAEALVYGYNISEAQVTPARDDVQRLWSYSSPPFQFRSDENGHLDIVQRTRGALVPLDRERVALAVHDPMGSAPQGQSLFLSIPMVANTWLVTLASHERTWKRSGTPRYHVHWKEPQGLSDPKGDIATRVRGAIETQWNKAMKASEVDGQIMDFVSAGGDIAVLTIGHDGQAMDIQVSKRALVEEIVVVTGIPPFLFGYAWSTTERMSDVQAGLLSSMVGCIRREVGGALRQHVGLRQRLAAQRGTWSMEWPAMSLQDAKDVAQAAMWAAQARSIEQRVERQLWADGVTDQAAYAEAMTGSEEVARPMDDPPAPIGAVSPLAGALVAPADAAKLWCEFAREYPQLWERHGHLHLDTGARAGADDPVQIRPTETPQYDGLRGAVGQAWSATHRAFGKLRDRWFSAIGVELEALGASSYFMATARGKELPDGAEAAIDRAIADFLRDFAGDTRTRQGFLNPDTEDGILQQSILMGHEAGVERGAELARWPMNPDLTQAARSDLLSRAFERLTQDGQMRFELRLQEIRDAMLDAFDTGRNPLDVARELGEDLDGYENGRLRTIVRTEMAFSSERGCRDLYRDAGVERVRVIGDPNTDSACTSHIGEEYALDDEDSLPPYHPNCFCSVVPVVPEEDQ